MYEKFIKGNKVERLEGFFPSSLKEMPIELNSLFDECGGNSFNDGVYRVYNEKLAIYWKEIIERHFSEYKGRIWPFASDWMGRLFAIDYQRINIIVVFDPATVEVFEASNELKTFHNVMLLNKDDDLLEAAKFREVMSFLGQTTLAFNNCLGFKKPLFLNGPDELDNLEIIDVEVYWEFQVQIYNQIKDLPPGTKIDLTRFIRR
ncbi:T6SS immunity protein Tdi1 domain-containing protein [Dinghuibacter silviterrae]|uniref:Uncharacterized protein DUF1851 n=1 Tax=Dinghuibacter silviterrae TaxID=1539049 RepID=A0A4R8DMJ3_9BACT|nr:T6SS immunity protein Tdi1 domain-containing protein [Dinghuibacter silviterrae]TDW99183.1 uncharacterized protein DUF1851 [Dinghuibacter silviterrae]